VEAARDDGHVLARVDVVQYPTEQAVGVQFTRNLVRFQSSGGRALDERARVFRSLGDRDGEVLGALQKHCRLALVRGAQAQAQHGRNGVEEPTAA